MGEELQKNVFNLEDLNAQVEGCYHRRRSLEVNCFAVTSQIQESSSFS